MNTFTKGILLATLVCCIWPLIVHGVIVYLGRNGARIQWDQIQWPWSKHD
jgi:hypothetical protein